MKKFAAVLIILLCSISLYAQQPAPAPADSSIVPPAPLAPKKASSGFAKFGLAAEVTLNGLSTLPAGVNNNYIGGMGFAINVQRKIYLIKNNFYFSLGLGLATYDYATNASILYGSTNTSTYTPNYSYFQQISDTSKYTKNKLNLVWLQVPLEFHIDGNPNADGKYVDFEFGGRFGLLINDHTKYLSTDQFGDDYKVKVYDIKNLNPIATLLTAKIGYDHANLFAYYNPLSLFKSGNGYSTNEFGFGIAMTI